MRDERAYHRPYSLDAINYRHRLRRCDARARDERLLGDAFQADIDG